MNQEQFNAACRKTQTLFQNENATPCRVPDKPWCTDHLLWMLREAVGFYATKPEKANRWLGFVQGCMACHGYKLDDLKRANMPEGETFDGERI